MCVVLVSEAVEAGARRFKACEVLGISVRTLQRWEKRLEKSDQRRGAKDKPKNSLSEAEKELIVEIGRAHV